MDVIEARNLVKIYPNGIRAVDGINLRVRRGEIFGFLGPNGAGKTTTLGMLTTWIRPTSGEARVAGHDVVREPKEVRRRIGVVFQDPSVDRDLTGWENLWIHGLVFGLRGRELEERIREALKLVELSDFADERVRNYSGGMIRRLEIARAFLHVPEVLFLDEPTIGLDPQTRRRIWEIIRELRNQGVTIFLTTHYMEEAEELCDRIAIIDRGRIIAEGTLEELRRIVGEEVIYLRVDDGRDKLLEALEGEWRIKLMEDGTISLVVEHAPSTIPRIAELAGSLGVRIREISYRRPTLEDVFIQLTGRRIRDEEGTFKDFARMIARRFGR